MRFESGLILVFLNEHELSRILFVNEQLIAQTPGLRPRRPNECFELFANLGLHTCPRDGASDDMKRFF